LEVSWFRSEAVLRPSLQRLHTLWDSVRGRPATSQVRDLVRTREAVAMVATARWMHTAALARTETRGLHSLVEHPHPDPAQVHRLTVSGLDLLRVAVAAIPRETNSDVLQERAS
jgi:succinate dehydrogenase/fumarate reductase flavoprotein subunit